MKLTLALLAAFLAVCQITADVPAFNIDREYKYEYKARAFTGVAKKDVKQFSGFGSTGTIIIQNQGNNIFLKFDNIKHGQFNGKPDVDMKEEFPMTYTPLDGPFTFVKEALSKPVRVTIEKGLVKSFDVYPEDPEWSVNVKKSILSIFQLDFDRVHTIRVGKSNYLKPDEDADFYRVMEDGIGGECETIYQINSQPYYKFPYERVMNVTKHRNYNKCTHRAYSLCSSHTGYHCNAKKPVISDPLKFTSYTKYQIRGDRHYYTIEKIYNTGKHFFIPFGSQGETITSGVNQTVFLTETTAISTPITFPEKFITYTSLTYNTTHKVQNPAEIDLTKPNYYNRHFDYKFSNAKDQVGKLLPLLAAEHKLTDDLHDQHIPEKFLGLIKLLSTMTYQELIDVYNTYLNYDYATATPEKQRMKTVFFDALTTTGTNPAIKYILYVLEKEIVPAGPASQYFYLIPYYVKEPSEKLINEFFTFIKTINKETKFDLYTTMWLAFGSLVHRGCETSGNRAFYFDPNHKHYVHHDTCKHYIEEVYKYFTDAKEIKEQLLYLKVMGNMGCPDSYPYLKPIVTGEVYYPETVRLQAFWSLYHLIGELKEEILTLTVPIYFNFSESVPTRLAAFELIFYSNPTYSVLQYLAENLHKEPNHQVASFVYSSFAAAANSTNPCDLPKLLKIRKILTTIPPVFYGYQYAQKRLYNYVNDKFLFSGETLLSWGGSNESFVPESGYIEQSANIFGYNVNYFAFGFDGRGFSRIFKRLFGADGVFDPLDKNKSVFDIFRRHPRDINTIKKERDEIKSYVPITPRESEDFSAHLAFYSFDQEYAFKYYDSKSFPSFKESGHIYLPKTLPKMLSDGMKVNRQKLAMIADITYEVPTEIGFPLSFSLQVPAYFALNGDVKFDVEPSIFAEERDHKKTTHVKLVTDLKTMLHAQGFAQVAIKTPTMNSFGYGIEHELGVKFPLKLKMEYDAVEKKFHMNYVPSKTAYEMFHYKNTPFTFIDKKDNYIPLSEEPTLIPIVYKPTPNKMNLKVGHSHFGAGLNIYREQQQDWDSFSSYYKYYESFFSKTSRSFDSYDHYYNPIKQFLSGYMHFVDYALLYPTLRPYDLKVYFEPSKENPTSEYDFTIDFHKFFKTATGPYVPDYKVPDTIVQLDPTFRKVYGAHLQLVAKGGVERSYHIDFNTSYPSYGSMPLKFALNYWRTPVPNYDPAPFKLCYRWSLDLPKVKKYFTIDKTTELKSENIQTIDFGTTCEGDKKITIKTVIEKTDKQKEYDANPTKYRTYTKCMEDIKKGFNFTVACWKYFYDYYTLKKYTIDIDYKNMPEKFSSFMDEVTHWIKHEFFMNIDNYNLAATNPKDHIKVVANFSIEKPARLDFKVYRPTQSIYYKDIYYPAYFPFFQHVNLRRSPKDAALDKIFQYSYEPVCRIQGNHIQTFDHVHYEATLGNCHYIVAKDCSIKERFTVLAKTVNHKIYNKAIKLFVFKHKIEILPVGENPETAPLVLRVDDVKRNLPAMSLFVMSDHEHKDRPLLKIYNFNGEYIIVVPSLHLRVIYDGTFITIKISNFFHGFMCGLCGDDNGESRYEMVDPKKCVYTKGQTFMYSYQLNDGNCAVPAMHPGSCFYPYAPKYPGKCTVRRNKLVQDAAVTGAGIPASNVCFSTVPVPECLAGCKPTTYVKRRIGFHCLNSRDAHTGVLTQESKTRELTELKNKSQDYYEVVQYPENCVKA